jgi:hypothetical protein
MTPREAPEALKAGGRHSGKGMNRGTHEVWVKAGVRGRTAMQDAYETSFDRYETPVDVDEATPALEARVDRLEARMDRVEAAVGRLGVGLDRLEAKMARLERTVRWWIMIQMVCGTAWIAVFLYLTGRTCS